MDEIAALIGVERDELIRGIFCAMRGEPFDQHETKHWIMGWNFYWDSKPRQDEALCLLH